MAVSDGWNSVNLVGGEEGGKLIDISAPCTQL